MANTSRPMGLRPERYFDGSPWNGQAQLYFFHASQANDAYIYDLVQFDSANRSNTSGDVYAPGLQAVKPVVAALTTNTYRGVIVGFLVQPDFNMSVTASLGLKYRQASTARYGWVVDDYSVIFNAQESGAAALTNLNKTVDITYTAGSTTTGMSKVQVDTTTYQTAAVRPLRFYRYVQTPDNDLTGSNAKGEYLIANTDLAQAQLGA